MGSKPNKTDARSETNSRSGGVVTDEQNQIKNKLERDVAPKQSKMKVNQSEMPKRNRTDVNVQTSGVPPAVTPASNIAPGELIVETLVADDGSTLSRRIKKILSYDQYLRVRKDRPLPPPEEAVNNNAMGESSSAPVSDEKCQQCATADTLMKNIVTDTRSISLGSEIQHQEADVDVDVPVVGSDFDGTPSDVEPSDKPVEKMSVSAVSEPHLKDSAHLVTPTPLPSDEQMIETLYEALRLNRGNQFNLVFALDLLENAHDCDLTGEAQRVERIHQLACRRWKNETSKPLQPRPNGPATSATRSVVQQPPKVDRNTARGSSEQHMKTSGHNRREEHQHVDQRTIDRSRSPRSHSNRRRSRSPDERRRREASYPRPIVRDFRSLPYCHGRQWGGTLGHHGRRR